MPGLVPKLILALMLISILVPISILMPSFIPKLIFRLELVFVPTFILEIYSKILPISKVGYFLQENLFADIKKYAVINSYVVIINDSRPTKIYLVCNYRIKY